MGRFPPVLRNRTSEFVEKRITQKRAKKSKSGYFQILDDDPEAGLAGPPKRKEPTLPPEWVDCSDDAKEKLKDIEELLKKLEIAHSKRLQRVMNDDNVPDAKIDEIQTDMLETIRACEKQIHEITADKKSGSGGRGDMEMRKNCQRNLASHFQQLSKRYREANKSFMDEITKRQQKGSYANNVNTGVLSAGGGGSGLGSSSGGMQQQLLMSSDPDMERMEGIAVERSGDIARIAASMHEIHNLFKDMGQLVVDQGSVLDRIDYALEEMVEDSAKANKELKKAEASKKGSDRRVLSIMSLLAVCNIVMLFVLLVKYKVKYGWSFIGMLEYMVLMLLAAGASFYLVRYRPQLCHKACPRFAWWVLPSHTNPNAPSPSEKKGIVSGVKSNVTGFVQNARQNVAAMNMAGQVAGAAGVGQVAAAMRR